MQAWRISKQQYALDRIGTGAQMFGGRWNSIGVAAIYVGLTPAICSLEKLVHTSNILINDLVLVTVELPDDPQLYYTYQVSDLPADWDALPSSTSSVAIGDSFVAEGRYLGIQVPSAIMPESFNMVLNPNHPAFAQVTFNIERPFIFDTRLRNPE